ncbi:hypothetical protein D7V93_39165 [Corallococcus llansteffanensis]|uniref:Uncharacterized protein n=2 Tax=Corallococcus llansteffanensis TaxID=2316731 RepID=A0A3A8NBT7_9BACT|nr:hypothetical protein D7V93_39165 [Corallococcus llansteffanensis]
MAALLLGVMTGALPAQAGAPREAPGCDFRWECQLGTHAFSVSFDSESDDCTEDDMRVSVDVAGRRSGLSLKKAWYSSISNIANGESICSLPGEAPARAGPVSAFAVGPQQALVFFTTSGRPGYDSVGVMLLDVATGKLLDARQGLGESKEPTVAVLKTRTGFKLRLVKEHLPEVRCDCSAAFADAWMSVEVVNSHIKIRWM